MRVVAVSTLLLMPLICAAAEPLFPTAEGTTWNYEFLGERPSETLDLTEPNEKEHFRVTYRLGGTEQIDNKELRRFEIYRDDTLESVDLIAMEERGIVCPARQDPRGTTIKLVPPQIMLSTPLRIGTKWNFDGTIGETKVTQHYEIAGEDDVDVPAGKFRAWRIHCEQTAPSPATIDRWFVPATGFIKVETAVKGPSGGTLQKTSLKLKELPKVVAPPQKTAVTPSQEKFAAGVSSQPKGEFKTEFKKDVPTIFVRWHGRDLLARAEVRAVLIADNVPGKAVGYELDESSAAAPAPNSGGTFTLDRPDEGWTTGSYHIDFFINDELAQTVKFKIVK